MRRLLGARAKAVLAGAMLAALAVAPTTVLGYSGMLSSSLGQITLHNNWGLTSLSWTVTQNVDNSWHYSYTFSHPSPGTSHFVLETSRNITANDLFNFGGNFGSWSLGLWGNQGNSNPGIPEDLYGIKFDNASGNTTNLWFDSVRAPMWGDFYSKGGQKGAWNTGFTANDIDPNSPIGDGSIDYHLLVPDTRVSNPVPEPGSMLLMGIGLVGAGVVRRLRRKEA